MKTKQLQIILLISLSILFTISYAQAPNWTWVKNASSQLLSDYACDVSVDGYGNSIVVGRFVGDTNTQLNFGSNNILIATTQNEWDLFIAKYDSNGNILWAKSAAGKGDEVATSVTIDVNQNILVAGYFSDSITFDNTTLIGEGAAFLNKYDQNGNLIWAKKIAVNYGVPFSYLNYVSDITCDANSNIIITGINSVTVALGWGPFVQNIGELYLNKYDSNGNLIWSKITSSSENVDDFNSIAVDSGNNIIVTGNFRNSSIMFGNNNLINQSETNKADVFIAKYNSNGNIVWAKSFGGSKDDIARDVSIDSNGDIVITGAFASDTIAFDSSNVIATNNYQTNYQNRSLFLVKYKSNGDVYWSKMAKCEGVFSGVYDSPVSISLDINNSIFITGVFSVKIIFDSDTILNSGFIDFYVVRYDLNGNLVWVKTAVPNNGSDRNLVNSIFVKNDDIVIVGNLDNDGNGLLFDSMPLPYINQNSGWNFFIAKLNANITSIDKRESISHANIYPNPSNGLFTIELTGENNIAQMHVEVTNLLGASVYNTNVNNSNGVQLDLSQQPKGIYFLKLTNELGIVVGQQKLIVN